MYNSLLAMVRAADGTGRRWYGPPMVRSHFGPSICAFGSTTQGKCRGRPGVREHIENANGKRKTTIIKKNIFSLYTCFLFSVDLFSFSIFRVFGKSSFYTYNCVKMGSDFYDKNCTLTMRIVVQAAYCSKGNPALSKTGEIARFYP